MRHGIQLILCLLFDALPLQGQLVVELGETRVIGDRAILKLKIQNQCSESIRASRVTFFLMGKQGQVVGRQSQWLIGGPQGLVSLAPHTSTNWNVVLPVHGEFNRVEVVLGRVILANGGRAPGRWEKDP